MMSVRRVKICICLVVAWAAASMMMAQNQTRTIAVVYQPPRQELPDLYLVESLTESLAMEAGLRVIVPEEDSTLPLPPNRRFDYELLVEWGREVGSRYIIFLRIDERRLAIRKQPSIPWVISRYVVEGRFEGRFSLIDLNRNKVVNTWKLSTTLNGPRQWQFARDYPEDPDLQMSAPRKMTFLKELEQKAVEEIIGTIQPHLKGR